MSFLSFFLFLDSLTGLFSEVGVVFTFSPFVVFLILEGGRGVRVFVFTFEKVSGVWVYLFTFFLLIFYYYLYLLKGGGWHGFHFSPFLLFFVLYDKLLLSFSTLAGEGVWVCFSFLNYYLIKNWYFFYFLNGNKGNELLKNLLRREGIRLISLF